MVSFGLVIEYDKSEIFFFSKTYNNSNLGLNLSTICVIMLKSKTYQRYLGFYFNQCLFFKKYVCYYKTLYTVKVINMLENSTRSLLLLQKWLLYYSCIISIATYSFNFWFFAKAPIKAQMLLLVVIQCKTTLQILGVFHTSSTSRIEALVCLIMI